MFIETARKNTKAKDKIEEMKIHLSERGVVTQHTSVNSDQVKGQLPVFTGTRLFPYWTPVILGRKY